MEKKKKKSHSKKKTQSQSQKQTVNIHIHSKKSHPHRKSAAKPSLHQNLAIFNQQKNAIEHAHMVAQDQITRSRMAKKQATTNLANIQKKLSKRAPKKQTTTASNTTRYEYHCTGCNHAPFPTMRGAQIHRGQKHAGQGVRINEVELID